MCKKAPEIQEMWKPAWGDFVHYDGYTHAAIKVYKEEDFEEEPIIWLPRQDQLQNMIEVLDITELFDKFFEYYTLNWTIRSDSWWKTSSFEQLWLAFVMNKVHNKQWKNETWKYNISLG